jgi:hypothetical protein
MTKRKRSKKHLSVKKVRKVPRTMKRQRKKKKHGKLFNSDVIRISPSTKQKLHGRTHILMYGKKPSL